MRQWIVVAAALSTGCVTAPPAPPQKVAPGWTAPAAPLPTDLRRTTLIVRDIDKSLALYRDVLGFTVNYNIPTEMTGKAIPAGGAGDKARFALLSTNDGWTGMIGLLQWTDPPLPDPGPYPTRMRPGDMVLVMNTDRIEERCDGVARLPGVTMNAQAHLQVFGSRNGTGEIRVMGCTFFDPDGNLIEINQILED